MILAVDMGNTNITLGAYKNDKLKFEARFSSDRSRTSDQYAVELLAILELNDCGRNDFSGAIICSVVPELSDILCSAVKKALGVDALVLGEGIKTELDVAINTTSQIGSDLIAACVGAKSSYSLPALVIDMGTATKVILLNRDGAFCGCTISPGMGISLDALASQTSQLPRVSFSAPKSAIGATTVECMQSGLIYGTAAMLDGLCRRIINETGFTDATIVATGGYSKYVVKYCENKVIYDKNLVLDGLMTIYRINK